MRVLVTRPEKEGRTTAARLEALGHDVILEPLTTIVAVDHPELPPADEVQAVTATSLNAIEVFIGRPDLAAFLDKPFLAVGARTAEAARAAGFTDVHSADGDRHDLKRAIVTALDPAKGAILWLVGHDRAGDLVADLEPEGFRVVAVEVYRAAPVTALSETTRKAIAAGEVDAALVFSPRSGAILLAKLAECGFSPGSLDLAVHAISEATARSFREAGWRDVVVASAPNTDAMLAGLGPAPVSVASGGEDIRSSKMPPKSDKGRATGKAAIEASAVEVTTEPAADDLERIEPETTPEGIAGAQADAEPTAESKVEAPAAPAAPRARVVRVEEEPAAPPAAAPAKVTVIKRGGFGLALMATLLGGAAGVGGSYALALKGLLPGTGSDTRIAALEASVAEVKGRQAAAPAVDPAVAGRIAELEKRLAEVAAVKPAAPVDTSGLDTRIARLETRPPIAPDLSEIEGRITRLEASPKPTVDLSGVEGRLAKLESAPAPAPAPSLPADLAERLAALEAAAKARVEAAQSSIAGALTALPAEGATKEALDRVAGQVDGAIGALKESAGAEIAALKARIDKLGGGLDAENRALADRLGSDTKALSERLAGETRSLAERTGALAEDLRRRNEDFAQAVSERLATALASSDAAARQRGEEIVRGVSERLAGLSVAVEAEFQKRNAEAGAALDALKQRLQTLEGLRGDLDALVGRIGALETTARQSGDAGQKMVEKVGEAAAAAEGKLGALENRLAGIEAGAAATRQAQAEAVTVMALADLKSAVDAGRPFGRELAVAESAARGSLDLSALKPFADRGLPGVAGLRESWPAARRAALAAGEAKTGEVGVFDRLVANASGMVKVHTPGEKAGEDAAAIATRVDARLAAGDLAGAFEAFGALPEAARKASAEWGAALAARVTVDRALAAQTAAVAAKLIQQSQ